MYYNLCFTLIKILHLPHMVQVIMYFSMSLEIIRSVFKLIFSQYQYFIDH